MPEDRAVTLRDAEVHALRETVAQLYGQLAQWDRQLSGRLHDLQEQVATLEAATHDVHLAPAATPKEPVAYRELIRRIRHLVHETVPAGATVLVISRGDSELLHLKGRKGWHFPQQDDGIYAGYYPADSASAVDHLEKVRDRGADYLLIPQTARWWLDYYTEFAHHLQSRYEVLVRQDDVCWIIDLKRRGQAATSHTTPSLPRSRAYGAVGDEIEDLVSLLLPANARVLVVSKGDEDLVRRCGPKAEHFPQDPEGGYAGYYPARSEDAIAHLEDLRQQGAAYLLFPNTAFWWLDHYRAFREHLKASYPVVCRQQHLCLIFALERQHPLDASSRIDLHYTPKPW